MNLIEHYDGMLTAMTTERDGLREQMNAIAHTRTFEQSCQIIADLKQQLAVSQAVLNLLEGIIQTVQR